MSTKRKRVVVSLKDKLDALMLLDRGINVNDIANSLGVGNSTVKDWKRNRSELEAASSQTTALASRHTLKKPILGVLDEALWLWFVEEKKQGNPISGPILKEKALGLHKRLEPDKHFNASEGWLNRWKKRHGVMSRSKKTSDESVEQGIHFMGSLGVLMRESGLISRHMCNTDKINLTYDKELENVDCELLIEPVNDDSKINIMVEIPDDQSSNDDNIETNIFPKVSHVTAKNCIDILLQYIEQQKSGTESDVLFFKRWRDYSIRQIPEQTKTNH